MADKPRRPNPEGLPDPDLLPGGPPRPPVPRAPQTGVLRLPRNLDDATQTDRFVHQVSIGPDDGASGPTGSADRWRTLSAETEELLRIAGNITKPMENKIGALRLAMDLFAKPRPEADARLAELTADLQPLIRGLLSRAYTNPKLARQMQVAVFQYGDATRSLDALRVRYKRACSLPPDVGFEFLQAIALPKVRGKLYVLTNFAVVFQGDPLLGRLFPPRPAGASPGAAARHTGPLPSQNKRTAPLSQDSDTLKGLQQDAGKLWDAVRNKLGHKRPEDRP